MKYRQWKKNYKKRHGVNTPASIDKRKQRKAAKRALKHLADTITYTDFRGEISVKPQIISGDFRRLFQTETPVTVCGQ